MTPRAPLFALSLLLWPFAAGADSPAIEVVSVVGRARTDGRPLEAGARVERGTVVELGSRRAVVQLVIDGRLAVSLLGGARARLLAQGRDLLLERGAARLAGVGSATSGKLRLELGSADGGAVLVQGREVHVLRGRVMLHAPAGELRLKAGASARLGADGRFRRATAPAAPELLQRSRRYAPPPPWEPKQGKVALDREVRRVRRRVQADQQREREMASCGCTESSGPGAQIDQTKGTESRPENPAIVRVRVLGVPRKLP